MWSASEKGFSSLVENFKYLEFFLNGQYIIRNVTKISSAYHFPLGWQFFLICPLHPVGCALSVFSISCIFFLVCKSRLVPGRASYRCKKNSCFILPYNSWSWRLAFVLWLPISGEQSVGGL